MERKSISNKMLVGFLAGLIIVIITVTVSIILVKKANEQSETSEESTSAVSSEVEEQMLEAEKVYQEGDHDLAMHMYEEKLWDAIIDLNWDNYFYVFDSRFNVLANDGKCDEALSYYDNYDNSVLPIWEQTVFYEKAAANAENGCDNSEKAKAYREKMELLAEYVDNDVEEENESQ